MKQVTITQIRKYMANLNRTAGNLTADSLLSGVLLAERNNAYNKATVCLQAIHVLQGKVMPNLPEDARRILAAKLVAPLGLTGETKTLANSYLDGAKLENFAELAKRGIRFREYRNLKKETRKQATVVTGPARPSNRASQVLDTVIVIARASHLVNANPDTERKATMARNKAEKLLDIAQAKDIYETIARAKLAPTYLGDGTETSQGAAKRPAPYKH